MTQQEDKLSGSKVTASDGDTFEVQSLLGRGGMGVVYLARQVNLDRPVALKMIRHESQLSANLIHRLRKEAKGAALLNHPNIMKVFSMGLTTEDQPFLILEYIDGETLSEKFAAGRLEMAQFYEVFEQLLCALQAAHAAGLIHRDIKPSNVMITKFGITKLTDFGIAKLTGTQTETGIVFGSPSYMSPEQCRGEKVDPRTDLYSVGCIMYEALANQPPYKSASAVETMHDHIYLNPPALPAGTDANLTQLIFTALSKSPDQRFPTAGAMLSALQACKEGRRPVAVPKSVQGVAMQLLRSAKATKGMVGGAIAVIAITIAAACFLNQAKLQPKSIADARETNSPYAAFAEAQRDRDRARSSADPKEKIELLEMAQKKAAIGIRLSMKARDIRVLSRCYDVLLDRGIQRSPDEYRQIHAQKAADYLALEGRQGSRYIDALNTLGSLNCHEYGRTEEGMKQMEQALQLAQAINQQSIPSKMELQCYLSMSQCLSTQGQYPRAVALLKEAIGKCNNEETARNIPIQQFRYQMGVALQGIGSYAEAVDSYNQGGQGYEHLAKAVRGNEKTYYQAATCYLRAAQVSFNLMHAEGSAKVYADDARRCLRLAPPDLEEYAQLRGELEGALAALDKAFPDRRLRAN